MQTANDDDKGNFLTWHRYFTYAYETALRKECCYTGSQPVRAAGSPPPVILRRTKS